MFLQYFRSDKEALVSEETSLKALPTPNFSMVVYEQDY